MRAKADAGIQPDRRPPVLGSGDCEEPEVRFEKLPCTVTWPAGYSSGSSRRLLPNALRRKFRIISHGG
jgi:hypothetical protein